MAPTWTAIDHFMTFYVSLMVVASLFYFVTIQNGDPSHCHALLNEGMWLDSALTNWQPAGCMLHHYKIEELQTCVQNERVVFIGGNNTRRLFDSTLSKVGLQHGRSPNLAHTSNENVRFMETDFEFFWDTSLNGIELRRFRLNSGFEDDRKPRLVVVGLDNEFVRKQSDPSLLDLEMDSLIAAFGTSRKERTLRAQAVAFIPALLPNATALQGWDNTALAAGKIDAINEALYLSAHEFSANAAFAFNDIRQSPGMLLEDGLHPSQEAEDWMVQILFNYACNRDLPKRYPFASTCSNYYPWPHWFQLTILLGITFLLAFAIVLWGMGFTCEESWYLSIMPHRDYLLPLLLLGTTVALCYMFDRSIFWEKAHKQTSPASFFVLMVLIILGSLLTLKTVDSEQPFLSRDQTDEWKGWMQVAILVYHYVGVSKAEYIYNYMRVCPTSYLFMTGFGHTIYFLKKGDYSFRRVAATMLRLNLLNALLAYTMNTDWLLYYFAPLVTWNFFLVYFTLFFYQRYNNSIRFLLLKIAGFQGLNWAIYHIPGVLESLWWFLQTTLRMQGDLREWRFRITLDQFAVVPGMLAAIIYLHWTELGIASWPTYPALKRTVLAFASVIMLIYVPFEAMMPSKQTYNTWHPYTAWLPCVSFVLLRNATPRLRRTHNGLFAWFGRGSLETFLLQFHLWLAADTAGLLVLPGLWWARGINAALVTPMFLWISAKATDATPDVIAWIMAAGAAPAEQRAAQIELLSLGEKRTPELPCPRTWLRVLDAAADALFTDYRVRVGVLLGLMVVVNWTYYL